MSWFIRSFMGASSNYRMSITVGFPGWETDSGNPLPSFPSVNQVKQLLGKLQQTFNNWDVTLCVKRVTEFTYHAVPYDSGSSVDKDYKPVTTLNILHNQHLPTSNNKSAQDLIVELTQQYLDTNKMTVMQLSYNEYPQNS